MRALPHPSQHRALVGAASRKRSGAVSICRYCDVLLVCDVDTRCGGYTWRVLGRVVSTEDAVTS